MRYKSRRGLKLFAVAALLPGMISAVPRVQAQDKPAAAVRMSAGDKATAKQIEQLVRNFLQNVPKNDRKVFQDFFADDVIYTRSAGVTVNKAEILKNIGVRATNEPEATYDADDVTVHPYGNMAVINFRLIQHNGGQTNYFRNTGTFLKRNGKWQAVAWQATKAAETK
ncbi:MAG TPA: nuclear transport factor 2 family protein [Candidatus Limnocylindrales bacterium]|nr:nuclear transport factor 2 family protein [Candidatus Limnocylindrales bacterium]